MPEPIQFKSITIQRKNIYSKETINNPFIARVEAVQPVSVSHSYDNNAISIAIDEDVTQRILELVAPIIAENVAASLQNLVLAAAEARTNTPLIEAAPVEVTPDEPF